VRERLKGGRRGVDRDRDKEREGERENCREKEKTALSVK